MASAKQLAWRKKFAKMSKAGKFKKSKKSNPHGKTEAGMTGHVEDDWTQKDEREFINHLRIERGFNFKKVPTSSKKKGTIDLNRKLIYV